MTVPYARVFDLRSCRDLLGKLERELVRLEYSRDRSDRADHGANFAIWAWQLTHWVYAEIEARPPLRKRLAHACGAAEDALDLARFQRYVQSSQSCSGLACCRAIATAIKPVESASFRRPADNETGAVVLDLATYGRGSGADLAEWRAPQWIFKSVGGGDPVPDIELFGDVLRFWTNFIHANHIA